MKGGAVLAEEPSIRRLLASSVRAGRWTLLAALVLVSGLLVLGQAVAAASLAGIVLMLFLFQRGERPAAAPAGAEGAAEPLPVDMPRSCPRRRLASPVLEALDMPVLLIGPSEMVLHQNASALRLFGPIPAGSYLGAYVRSPGILDMVRDTFSSGRVTQLEHSERLPSEAVYLVRAALAAPQSPAHSGQGQAHVSGECDVFRPPACPLFHRHFPDAPHRPHALGLRRQCQSRAAHAARLPYRLYRGPCRGRRATTPRRRNASSPSCTNRRPARAGWWTTCSPLAPRAEVASSAAGGGRARPPDRPCHDSLLQPLAVDLGVHHRAQPADQPVRVRGDRTS